MTDQHQAWGDRNPTKEALRQRIWTTLKSEGVTKRDPFGRIPNFVGAALAADRLAQLPIWQNADVIKCNPDSPQQPVRLRALEAGKTLYMAVPQLTQKKCFVELSADALSAQGKTPRDAATMQGALLHGKAVAFEEMQRIDLVLVGCVAAATNGGRTGKGAGFADLELAMLSEFGLIQPATPIATTIHELQIVESEQLPLQAHDWPLDWVITPEQALETRTLVPHPKGLDWSSLQPDQIANIPILKQLRDQLPSQPLEMK